jgi:AGCS family alanine or glycine:cation symporter
MRYAFRFDVITGGVLAALTLLVIVRGIRGVARLMQWLVPLMALLWVPPACLSACGISPPCRRF